MRLFFSLLPEAALHVDSVHVYAACLYVTRFALSTAFNGIRHISACVIVVRGAEGELGRQIERSVGREIDDG